MLTPQEVSEHTFQKVSFGGYNMGQVDEFLDILTGDSSALFKETAVLKNKMKVLVDKVEEYRSTEDAMRKALMAAQRMADDLVKQAEEEKAAMLSRIGCKVTYLAPKRPEELDAAIPFIKSGKLSILGAERVEGVLTDDKTLPCQGVFLLRDTIAPAALFPGLSLDGGYIRVDRTMARRLPGVFAAGDCTGLPLQIAKAVGEGQLAAHSAAQWLDAQKK